MLTGFVQLDSVLQVPLADDDELTLAVHRSGQVEPRPGGAVFVKVLAPPDTFRLPRMVKTSAEMQLPSTVGLGYRPNNVISAR